MSSLARYSGCGIVGPLEALTYTLLRMFHRTPKLYTLLALACRDCPTARLYLGV